MHWFNAICWIFLLFSGFALLTGDMQPIGRWWSSLWDGFFGGSRGLLLAHLAVGSVWVAVKSTVPSFSLATAPSAAVHCMVRS